MMGEEFISFVLALNTNAVQQTLCELTFMGLSGTQHDCSGSQNQDTGITCFHFSLCNKGDKPPLFVWGR